MAVIDAKEFCIYIEEKYAKSSKDGENEESLIDTIIDICEENNIDLDMVGKLINRSLKEKLRNEYINLNYMKRKNHVLF